MSFHSFLQVPISCSWRAICINWLNDVMLLLKHMDVCLSGTRGACSESTLHKCFLTRWLRLTQCPSLTCLWISKEHFYISSVLCPGLFWKSLAILFPNIYGIFALMKSFVVAHIKVILLSLFIVRKISLQAFDRTLKNMHASRLWQFVNHLQLNSIAHKLRTSFCNFLLTAPLFSTLLQLPTVEEFQTHMVMFKRGFSNPNWNCNMIVIIIITIFDTCT